jgi:hypothetical protein
VPTLRPKRFGDVPLGLRKYHRDFLEGIKEALEILMGAVSSPGATPPGSQAVTFDDLKEGGLAYDDEDIDITNESDVINWVLALSD